MEFNKKIYGGHHGARKFWREMLPRIKFRNPAIPIEISRHEQAEGPSLLHIYTTAFPPDTSTNPATKAPTPPSSTPNAQNTLTPDTAKPEHTIDIRSMSELTILEQLIAKTGAEVIEMTPEEQEEWEEVQKFKETSERDRQTVRDKLMRERHEQELMRIARGDAA
ncbi:unnamed protein product [Periconia digitata]|uniref:Ribosomal protein/NADH dehydrogenase domain-containing protein n=1 Tax=Periconia digitata TaxID=1303443 RepID=A0A9W4XPT7_9PLEO|nr:unnamed protein product [Periconia digitata]